MKTPASRKHPLPEKKDKRIEKRGEEKKGPKRRKRRRKHPLHFPFSSERAMASRKITKSQPYHVRKSTTDSEQTGDSELAVMRGRRPQKAGTSGSGRSSVRYTVANSVWPHPSSINGSRFIASSCRSYPAPHSSSCFPRSSGTARIQAPRRGGRRALRRCPRSSPRLS